MLAFATVKEIDVSRVVSGLVYGMVGAAVFGGLLGLSAKADDAADWEKVVAAGKKEGKVVVYSASTPTVISLRDKAFEKKYGIVVERLDGRSSEIRERIRAEQSSGRALGDLTITSASTGGEQKAMGAFEEHGFLPNVSKIRLPSKDDGTLTPTSISRFGILINTSMVKPEDEPKSWLDLLDPKWKGKILSDDPRANGGTFQAFFVLYDKFGREFHEKLAAQQPVFARDYAVSERRVARGEFPIYIALNVSSVVNLRGLPVKGIMPSQDGAPYLTLITAMLKGAEHPNAARLYMNFLLEDESQEEWVTFGSDSPTGARPATLAEDIKRMIDPPLMGTTTAERQPAMLKLFGEIYK